MLTSKQHHHHHQTLTGNPKPTHLITIQPQNPHHNPIKMSGFFPPEIYTYENQFNPMTPRNPPTQNQHQPHPTSPEDVEKMFGLGDEDGGLTTPQEQTGGEFYLHLHELKNSQKIHHGSITPRF